MHVLTSAALFLLAAGVQAEPVNIANRLEHIRAAHGVPALAAAAVDEGHMVALSAVGLRRAQGREPVTIEDRWHLGSCTKSMTAAVTAILVEDELFQWDTTIGEIFPEVLMHPAWAEVTIEQLLTHRGGAPSGAPAALWAEACARIGAPEEQRFAFVKGILALEPARPRGSEFIYSDAGYSIAGSMLERASGDSWEEPVQRCLFAPLALRSAGFGEPASMGKVDQPWGHLGDDPAFPASAAVACGGQSSCNRVGWHRPHEHLRFCALRCLARRRGAWRFASALP